MNNEAMLDQAQEMLDGIESTEAESPIALTADDGAIEAALWQVDVLRGIGYALVAIGRTLQEMNAKRPVIPLQARGSDPAAEDNLGDEG